MPGNDERYEEVWDEENCFFGNALEKQIDSNGSRQIWAGYIRTSV